MASELFLFLDGMGCGTDDIWNVGLGQGIFNIAKRLRQKLAAKEERLKNAKDMGLQPKTRDSGEVAATANQPSPARSLALLVA